MLPTQGKIELGLAHSLDPPLILERLILSDGVFKINALVRPLRV